MQALKNRFSHNKQTTTAPAASTGKKHTLGGGKSYDVTQDHKMVDGKLVPVGSTVTTNESASIGKHGIAQEPLVTSTIAPASAAAVAETEAIASTLPRGSSVERIERKVSSTELGSSSITDTVIITENIASTIPLPPPQPALWVPTEAYNTTLDTFTYQPFVSKTIVSTGPTIMKQEMPREIIERPIIIHESIKREQVEEIQPVMQIDRERTEIRQITQPLLDKEVRPVVIEQRILATEILPVQQINFSAPREEVLQSTRTFEPLKHQVLEKTPIIQEIDRWRVIEEVQPIVYREILVPTIIRVERPIREVVRDAPVYSEYVHSARLLSAQEKAEYAQLFASREVRKVAMSKEELRFYETSRGEFRREFQGRPWAEAYNQRGFQNQSFQQGRWAEDYNQRGFQGQNYQGRPWAEDWQRQDASRFRNERSLRSEGASIPVQSLKNDSVANVLNSDPVLPSTKLPNNELYNRNGYKNASAL